MFREARVNLSRSYSDRYNRISLSIFLLSFVVYFIYADFRHFTLRTLALDLGIFDQTLWSTLHGNPLYSTVNLCFDLVTAFAILEHLPSPQTTIADVYRALKPRHLLTPLPADLFGRYVSMESLPGLSNEFLIAGERPWGNGNTRFSRTKV